MFSHTLLDRRYSAHAPEQTLWVRANYHQSENRVLNGKQHLETDTSLLQIGADLLKHQNIVAGIYGGYGHSNIDNTSRQTGTTGEGSVTGYQIGLYGSWMPDETQGPYVDLWGYYAWFDNKLGGKAQNYTSTNYDGHGYALSVEAGYGIGLWQLTDGSSWVLQPHAQLTYTHLNTDAFHDSSLTYYSDNSASGMRTRLGARLYGNPSDSQAKGLSPFVELNWLHNSVDSAVSLNGQHVASDIAKNVGEIKIGVQSTLASNLRLWGHMGLQRGSDHYKQHELQIGLGWQW